MHTTKCEKCGAEYELTSFSMPMRDKDSIKCNYCDTILIKWNGGHYYTSKEISGPTATAQNNMKK